MSNETECGQQVRSNDSLGVIDRAIELLDAECYSGTAMSLAAAKLDIADALKDAARYRWLRDANGVEWEGAIDTLVCTYRPEVIDEEIDRAMAVAKRSVRTSA